MSVALHYPSSYLSRVSFYRWVSHLVLGRGLLLLILFEVERLLDLVSEAFVLAGCVAVAAMLLLVHVACSTTLESVSLVYLLL
jgi:hypothetical protein